MTLAAGAIALLRRGMADPETQWSLGTFGAIAEFSRDVEEPALVSMAADTLSAVTDRGGIALRLAIRPFASKASPGRLESARRALRRKTPAR
jgi:hypothetical protein